MLLFVVIRPARECIDIMFCYSFLFFLFKALSPTPVLNRHSRKTATRCSFISSRRPCCAQCPYRVNEGQACHRRKCNQLSSHCTVSSCHTERPPLFVYNTTDVYNAERRAVRQRQLRLVMVALCNRADHYIFAL